MVADWREVVGLLLGDKRSVPSSLPSAVRLGLRILAQGTPAWGSLAGLLNGDDARALFTGVAAHVLSRMPSLTAGAAGLMLATLAHSVGWPIPVGGSQSITDALIEDLRNHGGELTAGVEVTTPPGRPGGVVVFDTAPTALLGIYRNTLPVRYAKALRRYILDPGVAKVDFVLSEDIPWSDPRLREAPTLHLGGHPRADGPGRGGHRGRASRAVADGVGRLAAPGRHRTHRRRGPAPFWTYAHVPSGSDLDATGAVTGVVEHFAPGFRDVVVAARAVPAARLADHNANYVGGDIGVGGNNAWRAIAGPTPRLDPWRTPIPKVYLCSAATPPGGGVHGMAGYYAARSMLRREFGIFSMPDLRPKLTA